MTEERRVTRKTRISCGANGNARTTNVQGKFTDDRERTREDETRGAAIRNQTNTREARDKPWLCWSGWESVPCSWLSPRRRTTNAANNSIIINDNNNINNNSSSSSSTSPWVTLPPIYRRYFLCCYFDEVDRPHNKNTAVLAACHNSHEANRHNPSPFTLTTTTIPTTTTTTTMTTTAVRIRAGLAARRYLHEVVDDHGVGTRLQAHHQVLGQLLVYSLLRAARLLRHEHVLQPQKAKEKQTRKHSRRARDVT